MKEIKLTQGKVALVDDEDFDFLSKYKWFAQKDRHNSYAHTHIDKNPRTPTVSMHRMLLNASKGEIVDHIDRNPLNNQKGNLRKCTRSQNCANRKAHDNGASKYLGVSKISYTKKDGSISIRWRATITKNKKQMCFGRYDSEESAALAYNIAAQKIHGEFANLNVIN